MKQFLRLMLLAALAVGAAATHAADPDAEPVAASKESKLIRVKTEHTALTLMVGQDGRLYQLGYGDGSREIGLPERAPAREQEFLPGSGDGYILEPAIQATHADGNTSTNLVYVKDSMEEGSDGTALTTIEMKDSYYPFHVKIFLKTYGQHDVIEQWSEIRHEESGPVTLYRYASSALPMPGRDLWVTQFYGDYMREATIAEELMTPGIKVLDSKIGVRASRYRIPSLLLSVGGPAQEESGQVYGGSLKWSGSFQMAVELDTRNRGRALAGINHFGSHYRLKPNQVFKTPGMLWSWSNQGKGQLSRNFHHWAVAHGVRDGAKDRPVIGNNWEATHMDFDEARIVGLFDGASKIGLELFLLDDGWFGNNHPRDGDASGLGDWQVRKAALPNGLEKLAEEAHKRNLKFGIWIEPEMVNPRSDLYEKHPDWAIVQPHREIELSRNQLNLDMSRPEVKEFARGVVVDTLSHEGIAYTKWDANRYITQPGSSYLGPEEQSHLMVDYVWALYEVMETMARQFPNVMAMVCAGGGGRVDYGSMQYFHSFWPSDNTDPVGRVKIQWGFSHFFPANTMSAHVTRMSRRGVGAPGPRPRKFAIDVALSGAYGVDMDLSKCTPEEITQLAAASELYKTQLRPIVQHGDLYRLESPYDRPRAALNYVTDDKSKAALFVYGVDDGAAEAVKPRGLDPAKNYRVKEVSLYAGATSQLPQNDQVLSGEKLMADGVTPAVSKAMESAVIVLAAE